MTGPSRVPAGRIPEASVTAIGATGTAPVVSYQWSRRDWLLRRGLAIADVAALLGAVGLVLWLIDVGRSDGEKLLLLGVLFVPAWVLLFKVYGLYDRDVRRISHAVLDELPWILHAALIGSMAIWGLAKIAPMDQLTLAEGTLLFSAALILALLLRLVVRRLLIAVLGPERLLVIGVNGIAPSLARKLSRHPEYGVRPIGALTPDGADDHLGELPRLGSPSEFERAVRDLGVERALVCREGLTGEEVTTLIDQGRRLGVKTGIVPDTVEALGYSVEIDDIEGVTILSVNAPVLSRTSRMVKRGFDLVVASILAFPVLLTGIPIAVMIKLGSPGPVFYRQVRIGRGGRPFRLVKFRTMHAGADDRRVELMNLSKDPNWLDLKEDPRITTVGRFLRQFSLDELPQLINVLRGEMSMVGPRPLIEDESRQISGWARARNDLTPGVTGLWQVLGRTDIPFEEMVKLDYMYVTNWSLWLDFKLVLRTVPAVLARRGVN